MGGKINGFTDGYIFGRNPTDTIIANYRNLDKMDADFKGGYTTFAGAYRERNDQSSTNETIGSGYKAAMQEPGGWRVYAYLQGETIPKEKNHVRLSPDKKDPFGMPQLMASVGYDDNDDKLVKDFLEQTTLMFEKAGVYDISLMIIVSHPDWTFMRWEDAGWEKIQKLPC